MRDVSSSLDSFNQAALFSNTVCFFGFPQYLAKNKSYLGKLSAFKKYLCHFFMTMKLNWRNPKETHCIYLIHGCVVIDFAYLGIDDIPVKCV